MTCNFGEVFEKCFCKGNGKRIVVTLKCDTLMRLREGGASSVRAPAHVTLLDTGKLGSVSGYIPYYLPLEY